MERSFALFRPLEQFLSNTDAFFFVGKHPPEENVLSTFDARIINCFIIVALVVG